MRDCRLHGRSWRSGFQFTIGGKAIWIALFKEQSEESIASYLRDRLSDAGRLWQIHAPLPSCRTLDFLEKFRRLQEGHMRECRLHTVADGDLVIKIALV